MVTPKIGIWVAVYQKISKNMVLNFQRHHSGVTPNFGEKDVIFAMTS